VLHGVDGAGTRTALRLVTEDPRPASSMVSARRVRAADNGGDRLGAEREREFAGAPVLAPGARWRTGVRVAVRTEDPR